ncbi:MAG: nitroreductase [Acidimicrobiales bacterium]|nr:nitroreductase [Hyphomonadaceae bacterium]RZV42899.1 MAG: nitroreductase [Acidimicrobiales bacterium]
MKLDAPQKGEILSATHRSDEVLSFLARRRSTLARAMTGPGPDQKQLDLILRIAARVPDHRKLSPWRFIVFQGAARATFGTYLASKFHTDFPDLEEDRVQFEGERFLRAPVIVGVVSSPKNCPRGTPKWEQELSAGAVCHNMLLAARASGFAAQWLTEWYAFDVEIASVLGLSDSERMAGFIYMGTATQEPSERARPNMAALISKWEPQD